MTGVPRITVLLATIVVTLVTACGGRARVTNEFGSADLGSGRDATDVAANQKPGPISTLSEVDVKRIFGSALSALPPAPRHFSSVSCCPRYPPLEP